MIIDKFRDGKITMPLFFILYVPLLKPNPVSSSVLCEDEKLTVLNNFKSKPGYRNKTDFADLVKIAELNPISYKSILLAESAITASRLPMDIKRALPPNKDVSSEKAKEATTKTKRILKIVLFYSYFLI